MGRKARKGMREGANKRVGGGRPVSLAPGHGLGQPVDPSAAYGAVTDRVRPTRTESTLVCQHNHARRPVGQSVADATMPAFALASGAQARRPCIPQRVFGAVREDGQGWKKEDKMAND